jgi:FxsC-like protein
VADVQRSGAAQRFPRAYGERGLGYLLSVPSELDDYWKVVYEIAADVVTAVRRYELAPAASIPPLNEVQSAFHDRESQSQVVETGAPPGRRLFAQFVYIAARREEVAALRHELSAYGEEGGLDWQPYLPETDAEVGMIAAEVASRERFRYDRMLPGDQLLERISDAVAEHRIVVVIVDAWTVRLLPYHEQVKRLDAFNLANCVVMVPFNPTDAETAAGEAELREAVGATFVQWHLNPNDDVFVPWISSAHDLEKAIAAKLTRAKMKVIAGDEVVRTARSSGLFVRPPQVNPLPAVGS